MKERMQDEPAPGELHGPGLVGQLLARLKPRLKPQELAPPGQRSGHGSDSIEPYLDQVRSTRPSPLE
jgi:hypothetical protein